VDSIADFSKESGVIWVDDCRGRSGEGEKKKKKRGGGKVPLDVFRAGAEVGCVINLVFKQLSRD